MNDTAVYLAGPMTGLPEFNHPTFHAVTAALREQGLTVMNPAENDGGLVDKTWHFYMRLALQLLLNAEAIALLPGWENSRGAKLELLIAEQLEFPVYIVDLSDGVSLKLREDVER